jgi:hypothetical protein
MKNLASFSMIHQRVIGIKEQLSLETVGKAFDVFALFTILQLNEDEIEDSITDGSFDCGIDAIYISDSIIHLCNCKYTYDIDQTEKNFPGNEIEKIISTVSLMLSDSITRESVNKILWDKYKEIESLFAEGSIKKIIIHLISNKQKPLPADRNKLENGLSRYRIIEYKYYDLDDLVNILLSSKDSVINSSLMLLDDQHFEKSDGELKTIIGVVTAEDYLNMLLDKNNNNKLIESAFNDNVRVYKPKHSVNKTIINSALSDDNYQFFYQNNGITIICEECGYIPHVRNQNILIKNLQIVNGGQTTHSLFEAYKKNNDKVKNIDILVRICVAKKHSGLAEMIGESTNNQIPIGSRDLKANDAIQKKLQDEFETLGYYYERKANEFNDHEYTKVLNNELLAQLYLAYELDSPSEAKNNKIYIFNNFYEIIFDEENISAKKLLNIYKVYLPLAKIKKDIQEKKRKNEFVIERESFHSRAIFHILNGVKFILKYEGKTIECSSDVDYAIKKSLEYIQDIVDSEMEKRKELYTHDKFFKEIATNKIIANYISGKYQKN